MENNLIIMEMFDSYCSNRKIAATIGILAVGHSGPTSKSSDESGVVSNDSLGKSLRMNCGFRLVLRSKTGSATGSKTGSKTNRLHMIEDWQKKRGIWLKKEAKKLWIFFLASPSKRPSQSLHVVIWQNQIWLQTLWRQNNKIGRLIIHVSFFLFSSTIDVVAKFSEFFMKLVWWPCHSYHSLYKSLHKSSHNSLKTKRIAYQLDSFKST